MPLGKLSSCLAHHKGNAGEIDTESCMHIAASSINDLDAPLCSLHVAIRDTCDRASLFVDTKRNGGEAQFGVEALIDTLTLEALHR